MDFSIRDLHPAEYPMIEVFLYEALYVPPGCQPKPRDITKIPELRVYYENFGQDKDDYALAAEARGRVIGCVWARIMNDFSHLDDETPSLTIALHDGSRGQGAGSALIRAMLAKLRGLGYKAVSLSVQISHPARHLYRRLGFVEVGRVMGETEEEIVMRYDLKVQTA